MAMTSKGTPASKGALWTGRVLSGIAGLFFLFDGIVKLFKPTFVVDATKQLGYSEQVIVPLGIVLIVCTLVYLVPRTAVLGAILLTGYLGGAVATHVRAGNGWFETLFPVIFAAVVWAGLLLREPRLRALFPLRRL